MIVLIHDAPISYKDKNTILHGLSDDIIKKKQAEVDVPDFYILPKIHKQPIKGRPIVASHSYILSEASRWVDKQLQVIVKQLSTVLQDSKSLVNQLEIIIQQHQNITIIITMIIMNLVNYICLQEMYLHYTQIFHIVMVLKHFVIHYHQLVDPLTNNINNQQLYHSCVN